MEQGDTDLENVILNTLPESQKKIHFEKHGAREKLD